MIHLFVLHASTHYSRSRCRQLSLNSALPRWFCTAMRCAVGPLREHVHQNYKSVVEWEQLQMQPASLRRKNFEVINLSGRCSVGHTRSRNQPRNRWMQHDMQNRSFYKLSCMWFLGLAQTCMATHMACYYNVLHNTNNATQRLINKYYKYIQRQWSLLPHTIEFRSLSVS